MLFIRITNYWWVWLVALMLTGRLLGSIIKGPAEAHPSDFVQVAENSSLSASEAV